MEIKIFELRDRGTFMPVMAIRLSAEPATRDLYLLRRAGYGEDQLLNPSLAPEPYVILVKLDGVEAQYDPYSWTQRRTLPVAHMHIIANWNTLHSGNVIDVEYILGETNAPKFAEQM